MTNRRIALATLLSVASLLLAGCMAQAEVPSDLNTATTRQSEAGLYQVTIQPALDPVAINQIHTWTVHVETADGHAVGGAQITVDGGMPQHGHGLPTQPKVTGDLGGGDYRVEGMKFQMPGWWEVRLDVQAGAAHDTVTFNLVLE
jgi:hypothetical protein